MLVRFLLFLLSLVTRLKPKAGPLLVGEGQGPCQLQADAVDEAASKVDYWIDILHQRAMALMICQMQNMPQGMSQQTVSEKVASTSDGKSMNVSVDLMRTGLRRIKQVARRK